ncbi:hypothetical protein IJD44_10510 [bacterium]|nr:hypothetical protein [bacterium]
MISFNNNVALISQYNNKFSKYPVRTSVVPACDTVELSTKQDVVSLPSKVRMYEKDILELQHTIDATHVMVEQTKEKAENKAQSIKKIYKAIQNGISYKNVECKKSSFKGSDYATLQIKDSEGSVRRIAHIKNGEIQVIYDVLKSSVQGKNLKDDDYINANCYYFWNGECVEFISNIRNKFGDYKTDCEHSFKDNQWPCRNADNMPVDYIIGFKDNGGYLYYENYTYDIAGGYTTSVKHSVGLKGNNVTTCQNDKGFSYSVNTDTNGARLTEYTFAVNSPRSQVFVW